MHLMVVIALLGPVASPPPPKPATYDLEWTAPDGCPDAETIRQRVENLLPSPTGGEGTMLVRGHVRRVGTGFDLELATTFLGKSEVRRLEADACASLGESTALLVALALDAGLPSATEPQFPSASDAAPLVGDPPAAVVEAPSRSDGPSDRLTGPAPVSRDAVAEDRRAPAPTEARRPFSVVVGMSPAVEFGAAPGVGVGASVRVGLAFERFRVHARGLYAVPRRGEDAAAGLYQLGVAGVFGCARPRLSPRLEFPACVGVEGGVLRADSRGLAEPNTVHVPWVAFPLGAGIALRVRRIGLWSLAEAVLPVVAPAVRVDDARVFRASPVSARLTIGVEFFFDVDPR